MPRFFLDTCIFMAYAYPHEAWNAECTEFFDGDPEKKFTGKRVVSELTNRLKKRKQLYIDLAAHLSHGKDPQEFVASVTMNLNDQQHFESLLEILRNTPKDEILTYLREKDQMTRKGISKALGKIENPLVEEFLDPVCEDTIYSLIGNRQDAQILGDALRWSEIAPPATFLTLDGTDILRNRPEIIKAICNYKMIAQSPMRISHISEIL